MNQAAWDIPPVLIACTSVAVILVGQVATNVKIDKANTDMNVKIDKANTDMNVKIDKANTELNVKIDKIGNDNVETRVMLSETNEKFSETNEKLDNLKVQFDVVGYVVAALIALASAGSSIVKVLEYLNIKP